MSEGLAGRFAGQAGAHPVSRLGLAGALGAWTRRHAFAVCVLALALLLRALITTNADVSWLITTCGRILAGERLYVDIIEVNPPACFILYIVPVMVARATGLAPEFVVGAFTFAGIFASIAVSGRVAIRAGLLKEADAPALLAWTLGALAILPMRTFAEREHIAVIAMLPMLAVLAARAHGAMPTLALRLIAGLGAGATIAIKPHFAAAVGTAIITAAIAARSWRLLFAVENWIAAGVAAAYAATVVLVYPEFLRDLLPLLQAVYLPIRMPLWKLMLRPGFLGWVAALRLIAILQPGALRAPPVSILVAASAGFAACYLVQGKGWPYHSYPMVALGLLALAVVLLRRRRGVASAPQPTLGSAALGPWATTAAMVALVLFSTAWNNVHRSMDAVIEPIRRIAPNPTMVVIASDFAIGHPLVRQLGGRWIGRVGSLWISAGAFERVSKEALAPTTLSALRRYALLDRDMLAADIAREKPDIILVQRAMFDWQAWAEDDPRLSVLLKDYREVETVQTASDERFVILRRVAQAASP